VALKKMAERGQRVHSEFRCDLRHGQIRATKQFRRPLRLHLSEQLHGGRLSLFCELAVPTELYDKPVNKFVAGFIGTPPMNFFDGVIKEDHGLVFDEGNFTIAIPEQWKDKIAPYTGKSIVFGARPEDVGSPEAEEVPGAPKVKAKVEVIEPMGSETYLYLNTGTQMFISRVEAHRRCEVGQEMNLAVMMPKAHFFDTQTEEVIV
jgi:multiple sugar transport system ATP-binding protein